MDAIAEVMLKSLRRMAGDHTMVPDSEDRTEMVYAIDAVLERLEETTEDTRKATVQFLDGLAE